jgi:amidase
VLAEQTHPDCVTAVDQAARIASGLGHDVEEAEPDLDVEVLRRAYFAFVASGVAADLEEIGRGRGSVVRPADVEPTTWVFNQIGGALRGVDVESARRASAKLGFDLARFFSRYDVWLTPTCARPPARVGELYPDASKERLMGLLRVVGTRSVLLRALDKLAAEAIAATPNTQIANLAGVPAISLPLHVNADGLPIGTQWVAPLGREDVLLRLSAQLEGSFILGRRV